MTRSYLYLSVHHQETVSHPDRGWTDAGPRKTRGDALRIAEPAERPLDNLPPEKRLEIMQDCLEQNDYVWEKAAIFEDEESRTLITAILMRAETEEPIAEPGLWYRSSDEREGLAYYAQMALIPAGNPLDSGLDRFQAGLERARRLLSLHHSD